MNHEVSVIVPAYQVAEYIGDAMASIFSQTFTDYEVIVVNDGSPDSDDLERALAPYMGRIQYRRQDNLGAAEARNTALRLAQGTFVAFLDADDMWLPNFLAEQMAFFRDNPDCDLVYTDAVMFGNPAVAGKPYTSDSPSNGAVTFESLLRGDCNILTSGVVARRMAVMDTGPFDVELRAGQDFDLWLRMIRRGVRMTYQRKALVKRRVRQDGLSGDTLSVVRRELNVLDRFNQRNELSPGERAILDSVLVRLRANVSLELGKRLLADGDFQAASEQFEAADRLQPSWKSRLVRTCVRIAPRSVRRIHQWRTRIP